MCACMYRGHRHQFIQYSNITTAMNEMPVCEMEERGGRLVGKGDTNEDEIERKLYTNHNQGQVDCSLARTGRR